MNYSDITILKYQQIQNIIESYPDNPIRQWYNILPLLTDRPMEYYMAIPMTEFKKEIKAFDWLDKAPLPDNWVKEFTVEGETFFVNQYVTDWNAEQFISMSNLTTPREAIVNNIHKILAVCCYKENKYEDIDKTEFERRCELFQNHLPILTAYPISFFFAVFLAKLSLTSQYSLHLKQQKLKILKQQNRIKKQLRKTDGSQGSGTGIIPLMKCIVKGIGQSLNFTSK